MTFLGAENFSVTHYVTHPYGNIVPLIISPAITAITVTMAEYARIPTIVDTNGLSNRGY